MPTYAFTAAAGKITLEQRLAIVEAVTTIHAEETGAPRYLVQVIFYDLGASAHFVGGQPASAEQIWVRADIRAGRTAEQKNRMLQRILRDVSSMTGTDAENVYVYISDIPAQNIVEYGRVLPDPGAEKDWMSTLPEGLRTRLELIG